MTYLRDRTPVTIAGNYIMCAVPAAVMKSVQVVPALPEPKARGASADFHPGQLSRYYQAPRVVATGWVPAHDPAGRAVVGADDDPF